MCLIGTILLLSKKCLSWKYKICTIFSLSHLHIGLFGQCFPKKINNILRETSTSTHDDQIRKMFSWATDSTISES